MSRDRIEKISEIAQESKISQNDSQKMILVEEIPFMKNPYYKLRDLQPSSSYFVKVTAVNQIGEGYHPKSQQLVLTQNEHFEKKKSLYVWGSNNYSELGLQEKHVNDNATNYLRTKNAAYLTKPIYQDTFQDFVHDVA